MAPTRPSGPADPLGRRGRTALTAMTFNVRRPHDRYLRAGPDSWFVRAPAVQAVLRRHPADIVALQEVHPEQLHPIRDALGPQHVLLGTGRDGGGRGEGCLLAVDTSRFDVAQWRQRWLSPTPEVPGSRWPGDACPRTVVSADLVDRHTGVVWRAVATHLDPWPERARLRKLPELGRLRLEWDGPLVLLGDMNAAAGRSRTWESALACGLRDALAPDAPGTFHRYRYREPGAGTPRLDWILLAGPVRVLEARVLPDRPRGTWASDHFPVLAVLEHEDAPAT